MRASHLIIAIVAACLAALPTRADQILGPGRIDNSGTVLLPGGPLLGKWIGGKFSSQPDTLNLPPNDQGSTGDISGMRVGNARLAARVANNAELSVSSSLAAVVVRDGFASSGDGGRATYMYSSTACAISGGDGGSQIPSNFGGCWNIDWASVRSEATIELFGGAIGTTTAQAGLIANPDAQPALQKALDTGRTVRLGPLSYKMGRAAVLKTPGQQVLGRGAALSTLIFFTDFNLSNGAGVLTFSSSVFATTRADAPDFADFRIKGFQPDVNTAQTDAQQLASLVQVSCIDARGGYRASFRRLVLTVCMRGIDLRGDTGQTVIDDLLGSNFVTDIEIDGALDTIRVTKHHNFPTNITANQAALARRTAVAIRSGRMDDLKVSDSMCIAARLCYHQYNGIVRTIAADGYVSPGGFTSAAFSNYNFDIYNQGWQVDNGTVTFVGGYYASDKGGLINAGVVNVVAPSLIAANSNNYFTLNAGMLNISSAPISDNNTNFTFILQNGGQLSFNGNNYGWNPSASANTSKSKIVVNGGTIVATGNTVQSRGPGTQGPDAYFFKIVSDGNHAITGNSVPGWQNFRAPPILGRYGENAWSANGGFPTLAALSAVRAPASTFGQSFIISDAPATKAYGDVASGGSANVGRVTSDGANYRWY